MPLLPTGIKVDITTYGAGAAATCTVSGGAVDTVTITNPGFYYHSAPTISLDYGVYYTTIATATATVSGGVITALTITSGGTGYLATPKISFSFGGGSGATATATVSGGVVTALTLTN